MKLHLHVSLKDRFPVMLASKIQLHYTSVKYSGVSLFRQECNFVKNVISPNEYFHHFFTCMASQAHSEMGISKSKRKAVCLVIKQ